MLEITSAILLPLEEIELSPIRAQGSGGQHVNKVSTAIHLRFDSQASSLPHAVREALLTNRDRRVSAGGVVTIKAQRFRSQARNRQDALERLVALIRASCQPPRPRLPTRPTLASKKRRLNDKKSRSGVKELRRNVDT